MIPWLPALESLNSPPLRGVWHWTGGVGYPNATDLASYHILVDKDGLYYKGVDIDLNMRKVGREKPYAAHTSRFNSYSIGIAMCGMFKSHPGGPYGAHPINEEQFKATAKVVALLSKKYKLPITPENWPHHKEVDWLFNIPQPFKWDVTELPWDRSIKKESVGDYFRSLARSYLYPSPDVKPINPPPYLASSAVRHKLGRAVDRRIRRG